MKIDAWSEVGSIRLTKCMFVVAVLGLLGCSNDSDGRDDGSNSGASSGPMPDADDGAPMPGDDDSGDDEGGDDGGEPEDPVCAREDPNLLDNDRLFACEPETTLGGARQRLRLVDQEYFQATMAAAGGEEYTPPFGGVGADPRFEYRSYAYEYSPTEIDMTLLFGKADRFFSKIVDEEGGGGLMKEYRACLTELQEQGSMSVECVESALSQLGLRMFRRTLTADELDKYVGIFTDHRGEAGDEEAYGMALESIVVSPQSYYITEIGDPSSVDAHGRVRLTQHEIADSIAYSLLGEPSKPAYEAANNGELGTKAEVEAMVRTLLEEAISAKNVNDKTRFAEMFEDWLLYHRVLEVARDKDKRNDPEGEDKAAGNPGSFGSDTFNVLRYKLAQPGDFLEHLLLDPIESLDDEGNPVRYPESEGRAGFLTERSFLTYWAHQNETDPIRRGKFIYTQLLCRTVPDLPLGVVAEVPGPDRGTMRERLNEHVEETQCQGCHQYMDPMGFVFEGFGHTGLARTMEHVPWPENSDGYQVPVDTTGALVGTGDLDGPISNPIELSEKLASSQRVLDCTTRNVFRAMAGRDEKFADACALESMERAYLDSGGDLEEAIVAYFTSDAFLYRHRAPENSCELYDPENPS